MYVPATAAICAVLALGLTWHIMTERAKYWALAESSPSGVSEGEAGMKLLIVGNSFIYYNGGADKVLAELIEEQLGIKVYARRYTPGGYFWQQHLKDAFNPRRALYKLLGPGGNTAWDHIIFQEQSQAPALGGAASLASLEALEGLARLATARTEHTTLLMTWGYEIGDPGGHPAIFPDYEAMQERLIVGYISLAAGLRQALNVSASVAPAGLGWQHIARAARSANTSSLPAGPKSFHHLYAKDGIHPSPAGTYLEACIMASSITGCRCKGLRSNSLKLSSEWQGFLQSVADEVVFKEGAASAALPPYAWPVRGCALVSRH